MSNWIIDLFTGKKESSKEIFTDKDSIIPKYLRKAALTEMETAEEDLNNDWSSRVQNVSDFVLAEQITELELAGKGTPEKYNAHWQEVMSEVRKNRAKAEGRLLKLVPRHSLLDIKEFFSRIKKQNDKFEIAKDRSLGKKSDLTFSTGDKLVAKGTAYEVEVVEKEVGRKVEKTATGEFAPVEGSDYSLYVVKTASGINYYGGGDAHETFEKVVNGLQKEASKTYESVSRNVLEEKDTSGTWKEVISSPLIKDIQIRAEYLLTKTPTLDLRIQALTDPLFEAGETVGSATAGEGNAEVLQVDKENGMYVMKIPGYPTPVRKTFEKAHAGFHKEEKPYLPGTPKTEPKDIAGPESLPKSKTEYISEDDRAKLVKIRKEIEDTQSELSGAQEYSRLWQDLTRKLEDLKARQAALSKDKLLEPGMPQDRPLSPEEMADKMKEPEAPKETPKVEVLPPASKKLEPEGWWGWPNTERHLKEPKKHKKTNQGFGLSLVANSLTLELPNGSFLTSVHIDEKEAEAAFDKAGDLDSLADLFPLAVLEGFEKKAEDIGTGGPNMDGTNVMVDPQRGGTNQMAEGVEENPAPFQKKADDEVIEAQLVADMMELVAGAGGAEAVIAKAMEAGAKNREEIASQATKALVGSTHEVDFESQLSATGPNSSAAAEPEWEHHNQKFTAAECVPAMEKALDEFLPEEKTSSNEIPHSTNCPSYYNNTSKCMCEEMKKRPCTNCDGAPDGGHTGDKYCIQYEPEATPEIDASLEGQTFVVGENVVLNAKVGSLGEGTEVRITGVVGASVVFEAVHDPKIIGITKFAKVDKQKLLEKYEWENDGIKSPFELGDHVKVASATFLNGKALKGREGTIREKVIFSSPDASVEMFYLVEFDGAECTTLPGDCLKRGSTKKASFLAHKEATLEVVSIIVKRPDGWHVMSHKGKHLGGPYSSHQRAVKRLQQVEMFKNMKGASVDKKPWLLPEGTPEPLLSLEHAAARARFLKEKEIEELKKQKEMLSKAPEKEAASGVENGLHYCETHRRSHDICDAAQAEGCVVNLSYGKETSLGVASANGVVCDECRKHGEVCSSCGFCGCYHSDESKCMNADARSHVRKMEQKRQESSLKTAVMKPNLDVAQDFLDSFKIPPTVVSDIMVQEFLQKDNLHASKNDLTEIYKILQSSGIEVRISMPREEITAPTAAPVPKKKSSKEDPTDTEEAMGLKVGSKVQYTVKHEDELPGIKPGTTITGKVILMPIQHPEKDMSTGQPKEQGSAPVVTATVMWDKEELGTMRGLLPEELVKIAGIKYKTEVVDPTGTKTVVEKEMEHDMGDTFTQQNPDGSEMKFQKA